MHHHSLDIQTLIKCSGLSPHQTFLQNPRLISAIFSTVSHNKSRPCSVFNRKGRGKHRSSSLRLGSVEGDAEKRFRSFAVKEIDVATLGNICFDGVLSVPEFPPPDIEEREAYMERLSKSPPDKKYWEAGGNCNMAIAAVRLGLHCTTIGHVCDEICGRFLLDVLHNEGISMVGMSEESDLDSSIVAYETLLCWVLLDPLQRHGFCRKQMNSSAGNIIFHTNYISQRG